MVYYLRRNLYQGIDKRLEEVFNWNERFKDQFYVGSRYEDRRHEDQTH